MATKGITSYKAFNKDMECRGHKFVVGKTYKAKGPVKACDNGFHACQNPLDVLKYYPLIDSDGNLSRFAIVSQSGETDREGDKICSANIKIDIELKVPEFIKAAVTYITSLVGKDEKVLAASGNDSQLAASGDDSQLAASGNYSQLAASGDDSKLAASGDGSKLAASGDGSKLAASGYGSKLAASGNYSQLAASGNYSQLAASGNYSQLAASGNYSQLAASGDDSKLAASGYGSKLAINGKRGVVVSAEKDCRAKGPKGTLICLCHYVEGMPQSLVTGQVGKDGLKADTWYGLDSSGQFEELS